MSSVPIGTKSPYETSLHRASPHVRLRINPGETVEMGKAVREQTWTLLEFNVQRLEIAGTLISTDSH